MKRKLLIFKSLGLLLFLSVVLVYIFYYKSPAIRFAHRIFPLVYHSDTISEYRKDNFTIYITEKDTHTEVKFLSQKGLDRVFFVSQDGYEIFSYDAQYEKSISGVWGGGCLRNSNGKELTEYRETKTRLHSEIFSPEACDAIYIYKTYKIGTRGGKRAVKLILMAILLWLIFLTKLDAGSVWDRNLRYTLPMINDYGKENKSAKTKEGERIVYISAGILAISCVGILLYDVLCF